MCCCNLQIQRFSAPRQPCFRAMYSDLVAVKPILSSKVLPLVSVAICFLSAPSVFEFLPHLNFYLALYHPLKASGLPGPKCSLHWLFLSYFQVKETGNSKYLKSVGKSNKIIGGWDFFFYIKKPILSFFFDFPATECQALRPPGPPSCNIPFFENFPSMNLIPSDLFFTGFFKFCYYYYLFFIFHFVFIWAYFSHSV